MTKPIALILDPDESFQELMRDLLSQRMETVASNSIQDALRKTKEQDFHLIITDINVAGENSLEFIEKIKHRSQDTQIFVIAGSATRQDAIQALRSGAFDFLIKPFTIEDFALVIEKFFSISRNLRKELNLLGNLTEEKRTFILPTNFAIINPFINELIKVIRPFNGIDKKKILVIRLAVYEIIVNAMEHGNLGITYDEKKETLERVVDYQSFLQQRAQEEKYRNRKVTVSYHYIDQKLSFKITDEGDGFDVSKIPSPKDAQNLENLNGRGIFITKVNMDEIHYNEQGNSVELVKYLN